MDAALDEVASFVGFAIVFDWRFPVRSRRDNRFDASVDQVAANVVAVVALVAEEFTGIGIVQPRERVIAFDLVRLAAGDIEGRRVAFGVRAEVDFGREAAARAPERLLILIPPFTPAACWCARTIVESMACSWSAGGPREASVSKTASHTPSLLQRVKRTKTEFQLPYRSGMSRRRASAQTPPQNAVGRSPLVRDGRTTFAPIRQQWIENAPFRVRQIAPTQCCLLQKGSLESKLDSSVKNRQHGLMA